MENRLVHGSGRTEEISPGTQSPRIAIDATPMATSCSGFFRCGDMVITQPVQDGSIGCLGVGIADDIQEAVDRLQHLTGDDFISLALNNNCSHIAWSGDYNRQQAWYPSESAVLKELYPKEKLKELMNDLMSELQSTFEKSKVECSSPQAASLRSFVSNLKTEVKIQKSPLDDVMLFERVEFDGVLIVWRDARGKLHHRHGTDISTIQELPPRVLETIEYLSHSRDYLTITDTPLSISLRDGWLKIKSEESAAIAMSVCTSQVALVHDSTGRPSHLLCVDAALGTLYEVQLTPTDGRPINVEARDITLQKGELVSGLAVSSDGNLLLLSVQRDKEYRLEIRDRSSLRKLSSHGDGGHYVNLDAGGRLLFVNDKGELKSGATNFAALTLGAFERGNVQRAQSYHRAAEFLASLPTLDLSATASTPAVDSQIVSPIVARYRSVLPDVDTVEEVETLKRDLQALRDAPALGAFPEALTPASDLIDERENEVLSAGFDDSCKRLRKALQAKQPDVSSILEHLDTLTALRGRWRIIDPERREQVTKQLTTIQAEVATFLQKNKELNSLQARATLNQIEKMLNTCKGSEEVTACFDSPEVKRFLTLTKAIIDPASRDSLNHLFEKVFQDAADRLSDPADNLYKAATLATRAHAAELRGKIMDRLAQADTREDVEHTASVEFKILDSLTEQLPEAIRRDLLRPVQNALSVKARSIVARDTVISRGRSGEVVFDKVSFPVYGDFSLTVSPQIKAANGTGDGRLVWIDSVGREYYPAIGAAGLPMDLEDPVTKAAIADSRDEAVAFFKATPRRVPQPRPHWRMPKHTEQQLGGLAKAFSSQMRRQSGITILMGEAGAGKNVIIDLFGAHTNREVFQFSCNRQTDKEDISYAYLYDPERGTYKVDSQLLKAIQTPGAILVLDEINTLPPGVLKMLNAPLDERRCFFLPDGRAIKVDPSVILVGCMNPPWYLGTEQLSQEIKSRARFLNIDYPPVGENGMWRSDEAEMISAFNDLLKDIKPEKFREMWNATINNQPVAGLGAELTPEIKSELKALHTIVRVAAKAREAYRAFREGSTTDGFELAVSIRETSDICAELTPGVDVIGIVNSVLLNKVHDPVQQRYLRELIAHAI